ncbi:hypothetical protein HDU93_006544 [Gonapodya sp. JEL0774]|nr:hypothetical protein HDU93_006544 [Gonapodya sp. JEL0774]
MTRWPVVQPRPLTIPEDKFLKFVFQSPFPPDFSDAESASSGEAPNSSNQKKKSSSRRPPLDPKRREQNRAAQRAWRERKEKHLKDLEERVKFLEAEREGRETETQTLKSMLENLTRENEALRSFAFTFVAGTEGQQEDAGGCYARTCSLEKAYAEEAYLLFVGVLTRGSPSSTHSSSQSADHQYAGSIGAQSWSPSEEPSTRFTADASNRARNPSHNTGRLDSTFLPINVSDPTPASLRDLMKLEPEDDYDLPSARPPVAAPPSAVLGNGFLQFRDARDGVWDGEDDDEDMGAPISIAGRKLSELKFAGTDNSAPAPVPPQPSAPHTTDLAYDGDLDLVEFLDPSSFDNPSDWPMPADFFEWGAYPQSALDIIGEVLPQVAVDGGDLAQWANIPIPLTAEEQEGAAETCPLATVSQGQAGNHSLPIPPLKTPTGKVDVSVVPPSVVYDLLRKLDPESVHLSPENVVALRTLDPRRVPCAMTSRRLAELKRVFARGIEAKGECGRMVLVGKGTASGGMSPDEFEQLCMMMRNTSCEEAGKRVLAAAQRLVEARNALNSPNPPKDAWAKVLTARKELKEIIDVTPTVDRAIMTEFMKKYDVWGDVLDMEYDPASVNAILQFVGEKDGGSKA